MGIHLWVRRDRFAFTAKVVPRISRILSFARVLTVAVSASCVEASGALLHGSDTEITYWIDRSVWGQGLASTALTLFLQEQQIRPLHPRAASDNAASIRVLQKAGFRITGTEISYANARGAEIEETILRLD